MGNHTNTSRAKNTVLLIRLDAIGDFLLWLPAVKELRNIYPVGTHRLVLVANSSWAQYASTLPYFDSVIPINRTQFFQDRRYRWQRLAAIQQIFPHVAVNPTYSRELLFGDTIIRTCGAVQRVGAVGDTSRIRPWLKPLADSWYTTLIPSADSPLMELERNADLLKKLHGIPYQLHIPQLPHNDISLANDTAYLVVIPGALMAYRRWPVPYFVELIQRIHSVTGWHIVLCGGSDEVALGNSIMQISNLPLDNQIGQTTLTQLIEIISGAKLIITNETAAVHIAAAVATPAVCILGGGHYGRFMPYPDKLAANNKPLPVPVTHRMDCYGCNWQCSYPVKSGEPMPCIARITVDDVWKSVKTLLSPEFG